jgi:hypothetical protein
MFASYTGLHSEWSLAQAFRKDAGAIWMLL